MRYALALLGLLLALLSYSLFGSYGFVTLAVFYTISLYLLFFLESSLVGYWFLAGLTAGVELFGTAHLGQASFLALLLVLIHYGIGQHLSFTAPFPRYIVSLALVLVAYATLLFSWHTLPSRLLALTLYLAISSLISYFIHSFSKPVSHHELI